MAYHDTTFDWPPGLQGEHNWWQESLLPGLRQEKKGSHNDNALEDGSSKIDRENP